MKFMEAVKVMEEGKKVTRPTFNEDNYLYLDGGVIKCRLTKENAYFHYKSIYANDWEVVEDKKTLSDEIKYPEDIPSGVKIIRVDKAQEKLKEFIDWLLEEKNKFRVDKDRVETVVKTKEIFGERLI